MAVRVITAAHSFSYCDWYKENGGLKATRIHSALFQPEQGWLGYTWHVSQVVCRGDAVVIIIIVWSNRGGSIVGW